MIKTSRTWTFGDLLWNLELEEANYCRENKDAERGGDNGLWWSIEGGKLLFRASSVMWPGAEMLEAICHSRFGSGITNDNLRRLYGQLLLKTGMSATDLRALTVQQVVEKIQSYKEDKDGVTTSTAPDMSRERWRNFDPSRLDMPVKTPAAVAIRLRTQIAALERQKESLYQSARQSEWQHGITNPRGPLAKIASRVCGAWALIVRRGWAGGEYTGYVWLRKHRCGPHELPSQRPPWHRLNEFVVWVANTVPGYQPTPPEDNKGECWLWAAKRTADWLDSLPSQAPIATDPAMAGKRWVWDMYPLAKDSWGAWEVAPEMSRPDHRIYMYRYQGDGYVGPVQALVELQVPPEKILQHEAYAPTEEDFDLLRRLYPKSRYPKTDPHRPDWYTIKADLQAAEHDGDELDRAEAPVLLRLLKATSDRSGMEAAMRESSPPRSGWDSPKEELVPVATAYPDGVPADEAKKWPHLPFDWIQTTAASLLCYPAALQGEKTFCEMARADGRDPLSDPLCKTTRQRVYELRNKVNALYDEALRFMPDFVNLEMQRAIETFHSAESNIDLACALWERLRLEAKKRYAAAELRLAAAEEAAKPNGEDTLVKKDRPAKTVSDLLKRVEECEREFRQKESARRRTGVNPIRRCDQAEASLFVPDPPEWPGADVLEAICQSQFNSGLTAENLKKIQWNLIAKGGASAAEIGGGTIQEFVDRIQRAERQTQGANLPHGIAASVVNINNTTHIGSITGGRNVVTGINATNTGNSDSGEAQPTVDKSGHLLKVVAVLLLAMVIIAGVVLALALLVGMWEAIAAGSIIATLFVVLAAFSLRATDHLSERGMLGVVRLAIERLRIFAKKASKAG